MRLKGDLPRIQKHSSGQLEVAQRDRTIVSPTNVQQEPEVVAAPPRESPVITMVLDGTGSMATGGGRWAALAEATRKYLNTTATNATAE